MTATLYVVDARLQLPAKLLPSDQVLWVRQEVDGVLALRDFLLGRSPVGAIHLLSHGSAGHITLGSARLDALSLPGYAQVWAEIGAGLLHGGDLLIYGCEVAQGEAGQVFVRQLAQLSGADLAASDDASGPASLGGDSQLEWRSGQVEAVVLDLSDLSEALATTGDNILAGGAQADTLIGGSSHDLMNGYGGNDLLIGGLGDDSLTGGLGEDRAVFAGSRLQYQIRSSGFGTVEVDGPDGKDVITSVEQLSFSDSTLQVTYGQTLDASGNALPVVDSIEVLASIGGFFLGSGENEQVDGGTKADTLDGGAGHDTLSGADGKDVLKGGQGDDLVHGGQGDDLLVGGPGDDALSGGEGHDIAQFSGKFSDYTLGSAFGKVLTVNGPDGLDLLVEVETLQFSDSAHAVYGERAPAERQVNTLSQGHQSSPSVSALPDGSVLVTWTSAAPVTEGPWLGELSEIYLQRLASNGSAIGPETLVSTGALQPRSGSSVAALAGGGWVVSWVGDQGSGWVADYDSFARVYTPQGQGGDVLQLNGAADAAGATVAVAALADGGWLAAWPNASGHGLQARRYDSAGKPQTPEFKVSESADLYLSQPDVIGLKDGGSVVAWFQSNDQGVGDVVFKRYDALGAAVSINGQEQNQINTFKDGLEHWPAMAALDDGGWVVVWQSNGQSEDDADIYAQRYSDEGLALGSELRVNTSTVKPQERPAVTALSDGGWLVTWQSVQKDGSYPDYGIYGQRFALDGTASGGELQISAAQEYSQYGPAVAGTSDGGWLSAWTSDGQDGAMGGIYAQRIDADGALPVAELKTYLASPAQRALTSLGWGERVAQTIDWQTLKTASGASDPQGDTLSFRIDQVLSGTLSLAGQAVVPGQTLLSQGQSLVWTPVRNASGEVNAFEMSAFDGQYFSLKSTVSMELFDAPIRVLGPAEITVGKRESAVFSQAAKTAFSILSTDASGQGIISVHLDVTRGRGTLDFLGSSLGLTWTDGDGADGSLAFSGSLNDVNAALASGIFAGVGAGQVRLTVDGDNRQFSASVSIKGGLASDTGLYIVGDGSGGGGGGGTLDIQPGTALTVTQLGPGAAGGKGGGGPDTLIGTAGYDVIFGDGSGGGGGGGLVMYPGGPGGAGGGGADLIQGGAGNDILFGDGFSGLDAIRNGSSGGDGGLGGGGGGGANNLNQAFDSSEVGGLAGLGGGGGYGSTNHRAATLIAGLGKVLGDAAATLEEVVGRGGLDSGSLRNFDGRGGGGGFGGAPGGDGSSNGGFVKTTERVATAGADGDTRVHRYEDTDGLIYRYLSTWETLREVLVDYPSFGAGNDTLDGGAGSDDLFGLGGADVFIINASTAIAGDIDRIWDFGPSDRLVLRTDQMVWSGSELKRLLEQAKLVDSDQDGVIDDLRIGVPTASALASMVVDLINVNALAASDAALVLPNNALAGTVTIDGKAEQGSTLTAAQTLSDPDGLGVIRYQWRANGQAIEGADQERYTLTQAEVGKAISVTASYTDARGFAEAASSQPSGQVANVNDAPVGAVTFSGKPQKGQTLTAGHTLSDADGMGEVIYRWYSGPLLFGEVTGNTYTLTQDNVGKPISVAVHYTDGGGKQEIVSSQTTLNVTEPQHTQVQFWRDANTTPSELKKQAAVDLNDAIAILKMIVGLPVNASNVPLSPYQSIAADFDQSGAVNLSDAIGVLKMVVGLSAPTPQWKYFDDAKLAAGYTADDALNPKAWVGDAALADITAVEGDVKLVGVLSGDVNGSWLGV